MSCFLALFNWINLKSIQDGFAFILQNYSMWGHQVVGVKRFTDGEPLTLQLQVSSA